MFSRKVPTLLIGPPGAGKTARAHADFDYVETLLASMSTEEDIGGVPYREGTYDYRTIPALFRRLHEADAAGKTTALFLDELDKARRSVADTLLTLIQSRKVGEAVLPQNTVIIAAANPPEFGGGDGISDAMISRFCCVEYTPEPEVWATWARGQFKSREACKVIDLVAKGSIPILDMTGEGITRRITSPRTLAMALTLVEDGHAAMIGGLLTAGVASHIRMMLENVESDVLHTSVAVRKASKGKSFQPVRI
jgi:hypothetical protein